MVGMVDTSSRCSCSSVWSGRIGAPSPPMNNDHMSCSGRVRSIGGTMAPPIDQTSFNDDVDVAPPAARPGRATRVPRLGTFCSTGGRSDQLSHGGVVGRRGIEPPVSERRLDYRQLHPMARPTRAGLYTKWPRRRCSAVVNMRMAELVIRRVRGRLARCRTPGHGCWRPRRHRWLEPKEHQHDGCASERSERRERRLPVSGGSAGIGGLPAGRRSTIE